MAFSIRETEVMVNNVVSSIFTIVVDEADPMREVCKAATAQLQHLESAFPPLGGPLALVRMSKSHPVLALVVHRLASSFPVVAVLSPDFGEYVVVAASGKQYYVGDVIPTKSVLEPPYIL